MTVLGLHHISIISADAQRTINFYTHVLGMRLVKQTVNFDDPGSYHLYFGDATGTPGTIVTFFEMAKRREGAPRASAAHTTSRLQSAEPRGAAEVEAPADRSRLSPSMGRWIAITSTSIYFNDPDGTIMEIATIGPGWTIDEAPDAIGTAFRAPPPEMLIRNRDEERITAETWPEPVPAITPDMALSHGMHHITAIGSDIQRTQAFFGDLLGMRRVKMTNNFDDPNSAHWYWGTGDGRPGTLITYFARDPLKEHAGRALARARRITSRWRWPTTRRS